jgi:Protein of unknown function (DUF2786)
MTKIDRSKIIAKIQALMAKTTGNGATEAEAMSAAKKAGELLREYNLNMTEVELSEVEFGTIRIKHRGADSAAGGGNYGKADYCLVRIAEYCGVKVWVTNPRKGSNRISFVSFFGDEVACQMAVYLYQMIDGAIDRESDFFKTTSVYLNSPTRKRMYISFQAGMYTRLNARLVEMAKETHKGNNSSENALIVVKNALLDQKFREEVSGLKDNKRVIKTIINSQAYSAGETAANTVNLSRPIEGSKNSDTVLKIAAA